MITQDWNLDQLKTQLSKKKEVKAWIITEENVQRRERYFMSESKKLVIDQDRNVNSRNIILQLFIDLPDSNSYGRQGEITKKFFPSRPLDQQIDLAIQAAQQTDHQAWSLPTEIPSKIPDLKTSDPRMVEDLDQMMKELTYRIENTIHVHRTTVFNSSELFLSIHHRELHLSNGLSYRTSQSRIYAEAAFSFNRIHSDSKLDSDEYSATQWAVHADDLAIEKLFDETSERAKNSLDVIKPSTGKYSVIIDSEVLSTLLHNQISQLFASNAYNNLPFIKPGEDFIPQSTGDLLSISLDPTLPFGANTIAVSDQGLIQNRLQLVHQNRVLANPTDKQYGDYLGLPPTTTRGNIVVQSGEHTYHELCQMEPIVIEILQFSGLFADPNSGTFSSEIRLAKLYDNRNGTVSFLKGGSLSGSINENFKHLRLSKSKLNRSHFSTDSFYGQGYLGPEYALLNDVSIVG